MSRPESGSHQTLCWREMDSNFRSRVRQPVMSVPGIDRRRLWIYGRCSRRNDR